MRGGAPASSGKPAARMRRNIEETPQFMGWKEQPSEKGCEEAARGVKKMTTKVADYQS
jgi:hypothetical protein